MKTVVILPAFNESRNIQKVIQRIPDEIAPGNRVVIAVVDDGSTDNTAYTAINSGAEIILRHPTNFGVGHAFRTGLSKALDIGADIVVNIDADGQFDPSEIPGLVKPILSNSADVVIGSRLASDYARRIPLLKRVGNIVLSKLVSILAAKSLSDTQSGFRAFSKCAAESLHITGLFTYTQETILDLAYSGMRIEEVPISVRYFPERKSRVVKSIPSYILKVIGNILFATLRAFWKHAMLIFSLVVIILIGFIIF